MSSDADDGIRPSTPPVVDFLPSIPPAAQTTPPPPETTSLGTQMPRGGRSSREPHEPLETSGPTTTPNASLETAERRSATPLAAPAKPSLEARNLARGDDARATFEVELGREILGAERFRAMLLLAIPTVMLFALVIVRGASPDVFVALLHGHFDLAPVGLFLMAVAGFELFVLASIRKQRKRDTRPSTSSRYAQALVETSLPTAVVLYYAAVDGPVQALLMPSTFVYFVFILLSTLRLDFVLCTFTGLIAAGEYALIAIVWGASDLRVDASLASLPHHLVKASILLVSGVAAGFVAQRLRRSFTRAIESVGERQRILGVFGQHVSPQVVERLVLGKTEVKSELRDVCVMFLDIRDFTAFSETKSPAEVVDYLNTVFESTIDAVADNHGIINKFLGDGFMAIFGAPIAEGESCAAAVSAALDIVARIEALVARGTIPPTRVGIGLHAGKAVVGNIGSAQRKEYTVIGDVVNVAARIEALNKQLGSQVLASEEVWNASIRPDIQAIARDSIAIRGRAQPVRVWQLA
jgi:adenylate cyclase